MSDFLMTLSFFFTQCANKQVSGISQPPCASLSITTNRLCRDLTVHQHLHQTVNVASPLKPASLTCLLLLDIDLRDQQDDCHYPISNVLSEKTYVLNRACIFGLGSSSLRLPKPIPPRRLPRLSLLPPSFMFHLKQTISCWYLLVSAGIQGQLDPRHVPSNAV